MTHSAYLLSTVVLAAAAAIHLQGMGSGMDRPHSNSTPEVVQSKLYSPASFTSSPPVQTIGNSDLKFVQQPQRWVF